MSWRKLRSAVLSLSAGLFASAASAAIVTPGALVDLDAGLNPTAAMNEWTNNGTLGGKLGYTPPNGGSGAPNLATDGTNYYYNSSGSSWGTDPAGANNPALTGIADFSVEVWLRRSGNGSGSEHHVMGFNNASGDQYVQLIFREGGDADDILNVNIKGLTTVRNKFFDLGGGPAAISNNTWEQLVVTHDNTSKAVNVFRNGSLIGSDTSTQDFDPGQLMNVLTIFKTNPAENNDRRFNGDISRVRIYDFVLSESQIGDNLAFGNTVVPEPAGFAAVVMMALIARRRCR